MTLVFQNLRKQYGANVAIDDVSTSFEPGRIHGIIGPNGAGKSTLINMTAGSYTVSAGEIRLDGRRIDGLKKYEIANSGIARTYQNIRLFDQMTALENLEVCYYPTDVGKAGGKSSGRPTAAARRAAGGPPARKSCASSGSKATPKPKPAACLTGASACWKSRGRL